MEKLLHSNENGKLIFCFNLTCQTVFNANSDIYEVSYFSLIAVECFFDGNLS